MTQIRLYTRKEVNKLKDYIYANQNVYGIGSSAVNFIDENGKVIQMYHLYKYVGRTREDGSVYNYYKVHYEPTKEELIGAGIIK